MNHQSPAQHEYTKELEKRCDELQEKLASSEAALTSFKKNVTLDFRIKRKNGAVHNITVILSFINVVDVITIMELKRNKKLWTIDAGTFGYGALDLKNTKDENYYINYIIELFDLCHMPYKVTEVVND